MYLDFSEVSKTLDLYKENFKKESNDLRNYLIISFLIATFFFCILLSTMAYFKPSDDYNLQNPFLIILSSILAALAIVCMTFLTEGRTFRKKRRAIKKASINYYKVNQILKYNRNFILYLYDFKSGLDSIEMKTLPVGGSDGYYSIDGNHRRAIITKKLYKSVPIISLYNGKELNVKYKDISLIVNDNSWFKIFQLLYKKSKYVIMDYRDKFESSKNIKMELEYILKYPHKNLIFVGTLNELNEIDFAFKNIKKIINYRFKLIPRKTHSFLMGDGDSYYFTVDKNDDVFDKIISEENLLRI